MKLKETTIPAPGVMRCCFSGLCAGMSPETYVVVGDTDRCMYCGEEFRLTEKGEWVTTWAIKETEK